MLLTRGLKLEDGINEVMTTLMQGSQVGWYE